MCVPFLGVFFFVSPSRIFCGGHYGASPNAHCIMVTGNTNDVDLALHRMYGHEVVAGSYCCLCWSFFGAVVFVILFHPIWRSIVQKCMYI